MAEKKLRCAIYTRKSTEDGLEQEFNSLDAQYEACAAYALSQQHEGWVVSKERYDDGGFSGGNMERPGLKRLLADIEAGDVDIVLLYKIDRLTRSLTDFARIVDVMDAAGASFVSITQSFNTTTSMGRLTLNMLLSFAQFEREVTGERIRDKIAASKKKGIWMGGPVPLGYDVIDRKLVVNEKEAAQVRHIMQRYLALGTVPVLVDELNTQGYRTKVQRRTSGPHRGGCIFRRGTLYHLLSNRIYRGMIAHKGTAYDGEHEAIIDEQLWDEVQALLKENACGSSRRRKHLHPSLLIGKLFDGEGRPMTPSHAQRRSRRYRYYVTRPEAVDGSPASRVNAHDLERMVCEKLVERFESDQSASHFVGSDMMQSDDWHKFRASISAIVMQLRSESAAAKAEILTRLIARIDLTDKDVRIILEAGALAAELGVAPDVLREDSLTMQISAVRTRRGHELRLVIPGPEPFISSTPARDDRLVSLIADALTARKLVEDNPDRSLNSLAQQHGRCRTRLGKLVRLSCLAPDIVVAIMEGRQPANLTAKRFNQINLPLAWPEQRMALGFNL